MAGDYKDESKKKSNELQSLQDEFLVLQISLNVAESKSKKLEEENASLVNRWMKKIADEAEKMNDANAFLKRYVIYYFVFFFIIISKMIIIIFPLFL